MVCVVCDVVSWCVLCVVIVVLLFVVSMVFAWMLGIEVMCCVLCCSVFVVVC